MPFFAPRTANRSEMSSNFTGVNSMSAVMPVVTAPALPMCEGVMSRVSSESVALMEFSQTKIAELSPLVSLINPLARISGIGVFVIVLFPCFWV